MPRHRSRTAISPPTAVPARRLLTAVVAGLAALLLAATAAQAATPTLVTTGTTGGQANWLDSLAMGVPIGDNAGDANKVRVSLVVKHDLGRKVTGLKFDDDYNGSDTTTSKTAKAVTAQQPTMSGGYGYSRVSYSYALPNAESSTGIACPVIGTRVRSIVNPIRVRAVLDDGSETATASTDVKMVAGGNCLVSDDYPYLWGQSQSATSTTPGGSVTFTFTGDAPDANGDYGDWTGINYRLRRTTDGTVTSTTKVCYSGNQDGKQQTRAVTFPNRGHWVVEAELLTSSCTKTGMTGYWFSLGAVDVNTAAATSPTVALTATRPQLGGTSSVSATIADGSDNAQGGRVQDVEWDLDENTTNGVTGFEAVTHGDPSTGLTADARTIDTAGQAPGLHTVRARVTDNGGMSGADTARRQVIASTTYRVDAPPVATAATRATRTGHAVDLPLAGTDADGDALTATVTGEPAHGTLTGTGATRTYVSDPDYAGPDAVTFRVDDGYGGSDTATVTVDVAPDTTITAAPLPATGLATADVSFGSGAPGAAFSCRLDDGDWEDCTSPAALTDLAEGSHTFAVRATAAGLTDPAPASTTWRVYLTPPITTVASGPAGPVVAASATFTFAADVADATQECRLDDGDWAACVSPVTYDDLDDGDHAFSVRSTDPVGHVEAEPAVRAFTVDTVAPETTVTDGPEGAVTSSSATFAFAADEPGVTFACRLDGGEWEACATGVAYPLLAEGPHAFAVRATDPAGNASAVASRSWTVDTVAPVVTIVSGPDAHVRETAATVTFTVDDAAATTRCRLDGAAYAPCTSPVEATDLDEGSHTLRIEAVDEAGNVSAEAVRSWTVDTVAPVVTLDETPPAFSSSPSGTVTFSSDDEAAAFACRLDDGDWAACASPVTSSGLADGEHTVAVRATDAPGNVSAVRTATWTVDTAAPSAVVGTRPAALTRATTASLALSSDDAHATFACRVDGGDWAACTTPLALADLADGPHLAELRTTDRAGNVSAIASAAWTVDTVAPVVTIDEGPQGTVASNEARIAFSSDDATATAECRVDGGDWIACTSPLALTDLADGDHAVAIRATDAAGNVSAAATHAWRVERITPVAAFLTGPTGTVAARAATFTFESGQAAATFQCRLDSNAAEDWQACASPRTYAALADGTHTLQLRAVGPVSGPGEVVSRQWKVDGTAPVVTVTGGPQGTVGSRTGELTFAVDDATATVECRLDDGDWAACSSPAVRTGLADGAHTFAIRATDAAGNVGTAERGWTVDGTVPVVTIGDGPAAGSVTSATGATFAFTADRAGSTFACRIDGAGDTGWAPCTSPVAYTGLAEGEHAFQVRATTPAGVTGAAATRAWRVRTTAPAVAVTGGPQGATASAAASLAFTVGDGAVAVECRLDEGAWTACVSPAQHTGLADGTHAFAVRARDEAGNEATARRTWTVDTTAPRTVISSGPAGSTTETGATFAFAADEAGATFSCQVDDGAFAGCSAPHAVTGLAPGAHVFRVRAADAAGNVGPSARHEWMIAAPPVVAPPQPDPPVVDPPVVDPPKVDPPKTDPPVPAPPTVAARKGASTVSTSTASVVAATVACPSGACTVVLPKSVKVKVKGRTYTVAVAGGGALKAAGEVRLKLPKKLRAALRGRTAQLTLKVVVRTAAGASTTKTVKVSLKGKKPKAKAKKRAPAKG